MEAFILGVQWFLYLPYIPIFTVIIFVMALILFGLARASQIRGLNYTKLVVVGCLAVVLSLVLTIGHFWATEKLESEHQTPGEVISGVLSEKGICPECGEQVETPYCGQCGTPVTEVENTTCPNCHEPCDTPYCPHCGFKNKED